MKAGSHFCRMEGQLRGLVQGSQILLWGTRGMIEADGNAGRGFDRPVARTELDPVDSSEGATYMMFS